MAKEPFFSEEYHYQKALYLFHVGDYLSSSEITTTLLNTSNTNRDRSLLLLRLSDVKMQYQREYPDFATESISADIPSQIKIMDNLYRMREYEEALSLGKSLNSGGSRYFEGMSLLQLNRLEEATSALSKVSAGDRFYPYAMISLAQIEVMKRDIKAAEGYLKGLLSSPSIKGDGLEERVHILLGQILFERGLFPEAVKEFSQVSLDSPLYGEAAIGQAWSLMRQGDYKRVILTLKLIKLYPPYDAVEREAMMILGYSFLKLGWIDEAREHYQQLLGAIIASQERVEEMMDESSIRGRYASILTDGTASLNSEEEYYVSLIKRDPATSDILREYESLTSLKEGFVRKEKEISGKEAYIENKIGALEERIRKIEGEASQTKKIILSIMGKMKKRPSEEFGVNELTYFVNEVCKYWKEATGNDASDEARKLIMLVMLDWEERGKPECRSPFYICQILNIFVRKADISLEDMRGTAGIMEAIGKDVTRIRKRENTGFESLYIDARDKAGKEIKKDREKIRMLEDIRKRVNENTKYAERGAEEALARLDKQIKERLLKEKYELADYKKTVNLWLDAANNELAGKR